MDYATIKYDTNGNKEWVRRYDGYGKAGVNALALDKSANVYVADHGNGGVALVKYDTNGNKKWAKSGNGYNEFSEATAIAVDAGGNVYVTGRQLSCISCAYP